MGGRTQVCMLHDAGPSGLYCSAASWRCAAWHLLIARWAQTVDHGALLADYRSNSFSNAYGMCSITHFNLC